MLDPISHDCDEAALRAGLAFGPYSALSPARRAAFLDAIAEEIEAVGDPLLQTASEETNLPLARLTGERARTCGQLRMFAALLREGSWVDARIETADPDRPGIPKPDLRRMLVALGPVAVFGASNFPLAFSVAGGDTASALAAGCPVVVKAHPAHPKTSELTARAILSAAARCEIPDGVFALVRGGVEVGQALVMRPEIAAVAFTGSYQGGKALYDLCVRREVPIPVYAEMGSVNPLFVLPGALETRRETLAKGYADSLLLGVGQFCTNPGLVIGVQGSAFDAFLDEVASHLNAAPAGTMLHEGIRDRYLAGLSAREQDERLGALAVCTPEPGKVAGALHRVDAETFIAHPDLAEELFGPAALAVACTCASEMETVARHLPGQLTTTIHFEPSEAESVRSMLPSLVRLAGRIVANGFPTGVEVNSAMQHGGPFPATTDARSTSVGTAAIERFVRPVAFQSLPDELLPPELQTENPAKIHRMVNGRRSAP